MRQPPFAATTAPAVQLIPNTHAGVPPTCLLARGMNTDSSHSLMRRFHVQRTS